jgi:hypothetical protein
MGNTQLSFHQRFSFISPSQEHVAEGEGPDPVVHLFEADALLPQGPQAPTYPADRRKKT